MTLRDDNALQFINVTPLRTCSAVIMRMYELFVE